MDYTMNHSPMSRTQVWSQIENAIAEFDLLKHPFYQAWTAGTLTRDDLRRYAADYYHQVSSFPACLSALHSRLPDGSLRRAVLQNLSEEELGPESHADLWLAFAEGMGATRDAVRGSVPSPTMAALTSAFRRIASESSPVAALGAFYAYESQVARIAGIKAKGLRNNYGADARTCEYFTLHATEDVRHSRVWSDQMDALLDAGASEEELLAAVRQAAQALWNALDGIHRPDPALAASAC